ncbi:MAG: lactoylglutathione lyase [Kofleriaceae bacterium]|nr:lactoylglutathione lyase [Kofleriaceae bacterium]
MAVKAPHRILHTMLRVSDLDTSLEFYIERLGMRLLRRQRYESGCFTLAFLGYGEESDVTVLELTHNWAPTNYELGTGYGHIALAVEDLDSTCKQLERDGVPILRAPGPMKFDSKEIIAFIADPDGYQIEMIEIANESLFVK